MKLLIESVESEFVGHLLALAYNHIEFLTRTESSRKLNESCWSYGLAVNTTHEKLAMPPEKGCSFHMILTTHGASELKQPTRPRVNLRET